MDKCDIIDLCAVKSEKSIDTSTTIPLDENGNTTPPFEENIPASEMMEAETKKNLTESWIREQNSSMAFFYDSLKQETPSTGVTPVNEEPNTDPQLMDIAGMIPIEITELVNKECAIKLINYLVIYAINKVTEADLHRKLLSVTPDIDPQINYRSNIGFQCVYERCVVLFYEALLDLTEILQQFDLPLQNIVVLWMYNTVENICKAHAIDGSFLRNDKYIETLLRDFMVTQKEAPVPGNIFFNTYQKMQPTVVTAQPVLPNAVGAAELPKKRRQRKPRAPKLIKPTASIQKLNLNQ